MGDVTGDASISIHNVGKLIYLPGPQLSVVDGHSAISDHHRGHVHNPWGTPELVGCGYSVYCVSVTTAEGSYGDVGTNSSYYRKMRNIT